MRRAFQAIALILAEGKSLSPRAAAILEIVRTDTFDDLLEHHAYLMKPHKKERAAQQAEEVDRT